MREIKWSDFGKYAQIAIKYKTEYSYMPISGSNWEEVLYAIFVKIFGKIDVYWNQGSHEKGVDIRIKDGKKEIKISAKGGKVSKNMLSMSSYRLTRYDRLKEKLEFLESNSKEIDFYLICSREDIDDAVFGNKVKYRIFSICGGALAHSKLLSAKVWQQDSQGWTLKNTGKNGLKMKIVKSMSHQLWIEIPLKFKGLKLIKTLEFDRNRIGNKLHSMLR